jgi:hypothetical protein
MTPRETAIITQLMIEFGYSYNEAVAEYQLLLEMFGTDLIEEGS